MSKIIEDSSKIHGKGIFARQNIEKNQPICVIKGRKMFKINKDEEDALAHPDWVGFEMNHWVDPIPPFKYLNHSCNPNSAIKGKVTLVALKDITAGEEITIDYSIIEADPRWYMKCNCKEPNCRGIIRSIQFLPEAIYKKYTPHISKVFQSVYERTNSTNE